MPKKFVAKKAPAKRVLTKAQKDLRDKFAMHALPSLLTCYLDDKDDSVSLDWDGIAQDAYQMADAMLDYSERPL